MISTIKALSKLHGLNTIIKRGQIAFAKFNNEIQLKSIGANTYQATEASGEQILGSAMTSNFGQFWLVPWKALIQIYLLK